MTPKPWQDGGSATPPDANTPVQQGDGKQPIWALIVAVITALAILMVAAQNKQVADASKYALIAAIIGVMLANSSDILRLLDTLSKGVTGAVQRAGEQKS